MYRVSELTSPFSDLERPEHFTDHTHCPECAEHDATLNAHTPQTISLKELGNPGWDPICFTTDQAFQYYFPAMARLAIEGSGDSYYVNQFLFHVVGDGRESCRWRACSPDKRAAVVNVLEALLELKAEEIEQNGDADQLLKAIEIWSQDVA